MNIKKIDQTVSLTYPNSYLLIFYASLAFVIPFLLTPIQLVNGTLVNAALFLSVIYLPKKYYWPIIILPSLATLSRGLIFGPFTPFLTYFLPLIWLSNFALVFIFKQTKDKIGFIPSVITGSLIKYLILFLFANIFLSFHLVPKVFLQVMGGMQLITALVGGLIAYGIASSLTMFDPRNDINKTV